MAKTESTMPEIGTPAPDFALPDTEGNVVARKDFEGRPLLVMFLCNHCPYVKHVADRLAEVTRDFMDRGVTVVGINSNDVENYPEDSPEAMKEEQAARGYAFPYLFDETQEVALSYQAACTPDFFLYDAENRLAYRGQMDGSRPGNGEPVTGADLKAAVDAVLAGDQVPDQKPSMGCNIKWKPGVQAAT